MPARDQVRRIYAMAARLGVGIGEACDRIGMARSTPPRWKRGTKPRAQQLAMLRHAIVEIALERGTIKDPKLVSGDEGDPVSRLAMVAALEAARDVVFRLEVGLGLRNEAA